MEGLLQLASLVGAFRRALWMCLLVVIPQWLGREEVGGSN